MTIDRDELLDFIEDNGLTERQTIGRLLDEIEAQDEATDEEEESDEDEGD